MSKLTRQQLTAIENALGYVPDDERIQSALADCAGMPCARLRHLEQQFEVAGGRGVEMAEEIDTLRIVLAVRGGGK